MIWCNLIIRCMHQCVLHVLPQQRQYHVHFPDFRTSFYDRIALVFIDFTFIRVHEINSKATARA